jgi:hypothetical protein
VLEVVVEVNKRQVLKHTMHNKNIHGEENGLIMFLLSENRIVTKLLLNRKKYLLKVLKLFIRFQR